MDEQRAEFEAWAKSKGAPKDGWWIRQIDDGGYSCHAVDMAWDAWQAATQRQQERIAYVEKIAEDAIELCTQQANRVMELEAQVQALSLDAGRYRFIRDNCNRRINIEIDNAGMEISDTVDAAIDAAIAAGKGGA